MGVSVSCEIGTTLGGLATLTSLGVSSPLAGPLIYAETKTMAGGNIVRRGFRYVDWEWKGFLSQTEIDILRVYDNGAPIYISTPINNGRTYDAFVCTLNWPEDESGTAFKIRFTQLVEA